MKNRFVILFLLVLGGLCLGLNAHAQIQQQKFETRAVWLTTLGGMDWPAVKAVNATQRERQKQELCRILDQYKALHINTVLLQTRVRGTVIYPSAIEGWDQCMTGAVGRDPGYDPLQFAIEECHKRGMELHCWMVTIPSGNVPTHKALGAQSVTKTHPEICRKVRNYWYLDPGHPHTRTYLASLCRELVERYDVDGVHFDFIRYPENNPDAIDRDSWRKYGQATGLSRNDWRRNNITALVREMFQTVKALKPWVKVTAAPLGKYADTNRFPAGNWNGLNRVFQDAQLWMKEGIIDGVFPMLYHSDYNFYPFVRDWKENCNGRPVTVGLGIYFLDPREGKWVLTDIQRQMNYCRSQGLGVAHYRSKFLTDNTKGLYDWCRDNYYPYPSLTEGMTWMHRQAPALPANLQQRTEGNRLVLRWDAVKDPNYNTYVTYNVYRSASLPVDIQNPANLYAARLLDTELTCLGTAEEDRAYHYVVTAYDRTGLESTVETVPATPAANVGDFEVREGKLVMPESPRQMTLLICDLTEQPLRSVPFTELLDIADLPQGAYMIKGQTPQGRQQRLGFFFK